MLDRISRIIRREGLRGLYVRLRHPKQRAAKGAGMAPIRLPVAVSGGTDAQAARWCQALDLLPGARDGGAKGHTIRLSPTIAQPAPDRDCTIAWSTPHEVEVFCRDGARAGRWLGGAASLLVPSAACLRRLAALGLSGGRIVVLPPADATGELAGGLARWLVAGGALQPRDIDPALFPVLAGLRPGARLCLGLPEATDRRRAFLARDLSDFRIFDAIRLSPGWIGCGWSYRTLARAALAQGAVPLTVCEDDMVPPPGFRHNLARVEDYLEEQDWDLFSGLVTDLSENARITRVFRQGGLTFVHLDYATGMVFNIYGPRVLARLADWSPEAGPIGVNTIDAWLSRMPGLRVVTTLPFLAGHDIQARSTLFGFANRRYDGMIRASEARLQRLVDDFERGPEGAKGR